MICKRDSSTIIKIKKFELLSIGPADLTPPTRYKKISLLISQLDFWMARSLFDILDHDYAMYVALRRSYRNDSYRDFADHWMQIGLQLQYE